MFALRHAFPSKKLEHFVDIQYADFWVTDSLLQACLVTTALCQVVLKRSMCGRAEHQHSKLRQEVLTCGAVVPFQGFTPGHNQGPGMPPTQHQLCEMPLFD